MPSPPGGLLFSPGFQTDWRLLLQILKIKLTPQYNMYASQVKDNILFMMFTSFFLFFLPFEIHFCSILFFACGYVTTFLLFPEVKSKNLEYLKVAYYRSSQTFALSCHSTALNVHVRQPRCTGCSRLQKQMSDEKRLRLIQITPT